MLYMNVSMSVNLYITVINTDLINMSSWSVLCCDACQRQRSVSAAATAHPWTKNPAVITQNRLTVCMVCMRSLYISHLQLSASHWEAAVTHMFRHKRCHPVVPYSVWAITCMSLLFLWWSSPLYQSLVVWQEGHLGKFAHVWKRSHLACWCLSLSLQIWKQVSDITGHLF